MKKTLSVVLALLMMCVAFASCAEKETKVAIGVQSGTTGESFLKGDADWGFAGFACECVGYEVGALAAQNILNGNVKYVVIDIAPAKAIVENTNALN